MKKQILTAAVAAAIVLPTLAQAGVYGRADGVIRYFDDGLAGGNSVWDIGVDKMRWGIVGSEDLGNGMKALYHYEWAMSNGGTTGSTSNNESTRLAYAGLQGSWGKVTIGRQWAPSYFAVYNKTDTGDAHASGPTNFSGNRHGKSIVYSSPDMSGFSFAAFGMMDGSGQTQEDTLDKWELSAQYKNGPLQIGAAFGTDERGSGAVAAGSDQTVALDVDLLGSTFATVVTIPGSAAAPATNNEIDTWGIGGSYSFGDLSVEGHFTNKDSGNGSETDGWAIGATYKMGSTQIHGAYRDASAEATGVADTDTTDWYIGVRHFMSKETRVFAEYRQTETEQGATDLADDSMFALGLRKDWKL
jgi:predicted porin